MPLLEGTRLGPYEIGPLLGAGGMGEVYRARDTRLDRDVALKLLAAGFSHEPGARERFDREGRLVSQLSHPHICPVFDVGEYEGFPFTVMECLEGETLVGRLQQGALPVAQAMRIATEVADALDHAHRRGVVHRDLKPGNVMLTRSGAKLLDFGLAKAAVAFPAGHDDAAVTTERLTRAGVIFGTPQYMAPEQVRGHPTDHRTDIFAFGALLHEIITGQPAFHGHNPADVMAENMPVPAVSTLKPVAPPALDHVVARCLQKDPDERWQSAFDVASELRWIADTATSSVMGQPREAAISTMRRLSPLVLGVCGLLAGAAIYAGRGALLRQAPQAVPEIIRATVPLPPNAQLAAARPNVAISPDGRFLAFVALLDGTSTLFVRPVDAFEMAPVRGTESASGPFFSPDGEWIGFFANGRLLKVSRSGGTPVVICEATDVRGATWGTDDTIVFSPRLDAGLYRVSAAGGAPVAITVPAAERREKTHRFPELLPDGRSVMYTVGTHHIATFDEASIAVQPLAGGAPRTIISSGSAAKYLPSGYVVFARGDALLAVRFDAKRMEVSGSPVVVAEGVTHANDYGRVEYDVSDTGTLVYLPGGSTSQQSVLVSVDRRGEFTPLTSQPRLFLSVHFSPKGQSLLTIIGGANDTAWIYDVQRDVSSRISFKGNVTSASWTADGQRVVYIQAGALGSIAADGSGQEEILFHDEAQKGSPQLAPDGATLVFQTIQPGSGFDIWTMSMQTRQTAPWLATPFTENRPRLSPNGRWVAYTSNESGREEVYVRALTGPGVKTLVSRDGGRLPTWSADGRELFFLQGPSLMAVTVGTNTAAFEAGRPQVLFYLRRLPADEGAIYDVAPDGKRFVVIEPLTTDVPTIANVVAGWSREIARKILAK